MQSVTKAINDAHMSTNSTLGNCTEIEMCGHPLNPSINYSSAYAFKSIEELGAYHENKFNSIRYTRDSSLLVRQLEHYFSIIYNDNPTLLLNSGMGAISTCLSGLVNSNTKIITIGSFYRKSLSIFQNYQKNFGIEYININNIDSLESLNSADALVFIESPSNPFLELVDIEEIRRLMPDAILILDTTFQGLVNSKSNHIGIDVIISSCTKYIGGHNDLLGGLIVCRDKKLYQSLWEQRSMRGGIIDNQSAYFLLRSLRTYDIRMNKTLENIESVLNFLADHNAIEQMYYPGRYANEEQYAIYQNEHYHGGGVVTFRTSPRINLSANIEMLSSTKMAPSFGSVDSLIEIPMYMSHWGTPLEELKNLGLDRHTVRFSVGNEPIEYIIDDLNRLLK